MTAVEHCAAAIRQRAAARVSRVARGGRAGALVYHAAAAARLGRFAPAAIEETAAAVTGHSAAGVESQAGGRRAGLALFTAVGRAGSDAHFLPHAGATTEQAAAAVEHGAAMGID